jgi:hypothetical protein
LTGISFAPFGVAKSQQHKSINSVFWMEAGLVKGQKTTALGL